MKTTRYYLANKRQENTIPQRGVLLLRCSNPAVDTPLAILTNLPHSFFKCRLFKTASGSFQCEQSCRIDIVCLLSQLSKTTVTHVTPPDMAEPE